MFELINTCQHLITYHIHYHNRFCIFFNLHKIDSPFGLTHRRYLVEVHKFQVQELDGKPSAGL